MQCPTNPEAKAADLRDQWHQETHMLQHLENGHLNNQVSLLLVTCKVVFAYCLQLELCHSCDAFLHVGQVECRNDPLQFTLL